MPGLKKKDNSKIEKSPLLSTNLADSSKDAMKGKDSLHSTIHPERFDMSRFSDRKSEDEESSFRIIIYVVVVIVIGVGLALLVRTLISNTDDGDNNEDTQIEDTNNDNDIPEEIISDIDINIIEQPDNLADDVLEGTEFTSNLKTTFGAADSEETMIISNINYQKYTTFGRLELVVEDIVALPQIDIDFFSESNVLVITLPETAEVTEDFSQEVMVEDGIIESLNYNGTTNTITISLTEESVYRGIVNDGLILDFRTTEVNEEIGTTDTTDTTTDPVVDPTPDTTTDADRPTGTNTTNEFSQQKQFINSSVTGNTISHNEFYYADLGDHFEIAFGQRNNVGSDFIPNASAELKTEGGETYIELIVENLGQEVLSVQNKTSFDSSEMAINTAGANFSRVDLISYENGTAKYKVILKNSADFKLVSETTLSGQTQVLSLQIKD